MVMPYLFSCCVQREVDSLPGHTVQTYLLHIRTKFNYYGRLIFPTKPVAMTKVPFFIVTHEQNATYRESLPFIIISHKYFPHDFNKFLILTLLADQISKKISVILTLQYLLSAMSVCFLLNIFL